MLERKVFVDYEDVTGIDLTTAKNSISFPIEVERVQSTDSNKMLNKYVLFNTAGGPNNNERIPIGFLSDRRKLVSYGDMMDIVTNQLSGISNFKLIETSIANKSYNVTQRYLLDHYIDNPDGEKLAAMLIVNYSYTTLPMSLELGTFRYVCSNGAMVKVEDFEKISIRMHDLNSLYVQNIGNLIKRGLDNIDKISDVYAKLASEDWETYFIKMINSQYVSVQFKKSLIDYLVMNKELFSLTKDTIKNDTFMNIKNDNGNLIDEDGKIIYALNAKKSAWNFYNDCTDLSSHTSASVALRRKNDLSISNIFAA